MATISINIPDAQLNRVIDGVCSYYGYSSTVISNGSVIANPETKNQFARRMLIEQTEAWVATIESKNAAKTAYDTAITQIDIT